MGRPHKAWLEFWFRDRVNYPLLPQEREVGRLLGATGGTHRCRGRVRAAGNKSVRIRQNPPPQTFPQETPTTLKAASAPGLGARASVQRGQMVPVPMRGALTPPSHLAASPSQGGTQVELRVLRPSAVPSLNYKTDVACPAYLAVSAHSSWALLPAWLCCPGGAHRFSPTEAAPLSRSWG